MIKPILCLDFDGVLHSYTSGWQGATVIADPPTEGAMRFLCKASEHFRIAVYSSRSNRPGGIAAMQVWLSRHFREYRIYGSIREDKILAEIEWPTEKPTAFVTIDDRAITFTGTWPTIETLLAFKPWNKQ